MTRFALALALAAILPLAAARAEPPAVGTEDYEIIHDFSAWMQSQYAEDGQWCCSLGDGRPVFDGELRVANGRYQVLYSRRYWDDAPEVPLWLDVPRVLPRPSPVGYPIVWILHGRVYCMAKAAQF